jgi:hypothetical protein
LAANLPSLEEPTCEDGIRRGSLDASNIFSETPNDNPATPNSGDDNVDEKKDNKKEEFEDLPPLLLEDLITRPPPDENCNDRHDMCPEWARAGHCMEYPGFMLTECTWSCNACVLSEKERKQGVVEQTVVETHRDEIMKLIAKSLSYLKKKVAKDALLKKVLPACTNLYDHCAYWAVTGQCNTSATFMSRYCPLACQTCHLLTADATRDVPTT